MTIDSASFRAAMGRFASGVTILTGRFPDGQPAGMTVSAVASLSLEPPLVLACLGRWALCLEAFVEGEGFAINVLAAKQKELSETFASQAADKFGGLSCEKGLYACPVLPGALAVIECRRHAVHDGGDHVILVGAVERARVATGSDPLIHYRGEYRELGRRR